MKEDPYTTLTIQLTKSQLDKVKKEMMRTGNPASSVIRLALTHFFLNQDQNRG